MFGTLSLLITDGFIYLFVFLVLFVFATLDVRGISKKGKNKRLLFGICVLFFITSLRWQTGCDWEPYLELFKEVDKYKQLSEIYHFDYGYILENYIVKLFTNSYTILLLVNSFIVFFCLYKIIKRESRYPSLVLYLFYCVYFPIHIMGGNRRAVAIVLSMFFILFLYEKTYKKSLLCIVPAVAFHKSAIVTALAWFVPRALFKHKTILLILAGALFLGVSNLITQLINLMGELAGVGSVVDLLMFYSDEGESAEYSKDVHSFMSTIVGFVKRCLVLLYVFIALRKKSATEKDSYLINLYLLSIVIYMAFTEAGVLQVMSLYFAIFDLFLFDRFLPLYGKKYRGVLLLLFFFYGMMQLLNNLGVYPELYMPYKSIIFQ